MKYFYFIFFLIVFGSCAIPKAPTGGPKDEKAPVQKAISPASGSRNIHPDKIVFSFDERIEVQNYLSEVNIVPDIHPKFEFVANGSEAILKFKKADSINYFLPNTTYRINLGKSIKDITEGNISSGLEYIFSTGPNIDSAYLSGFVLDAYTNKPVDGALVRLDFNRYDSSLFKNRTRFYTFTNSSGNYIFKNLYPKSYSIFVQSDNNKDYLYDLSEKMDLSKNSIAGYLNTPDTFYLSKPLMPVSGIVKKEIGGLTSIKLPAGYSIIGLDIIPKDDIEQIHPKFDSIVFGGSLSQEVSLRLKCRFLDDTVSYQIGKISKRLMDTSVVLEVGEGSTLSFSYRLGSFKNIYVNIDSLDFRKINLISLPDSQKVKIKSIRLNDSNEILINYEYLVESSEVKELSLTVPRGTVRISKSKGIPPNIIKTVPYFAPESKGKLVLKVKNPKKKMVIIEVVNSDGKIIYSAPNNGQQEIELERNEKSELEIYYFDYLYNSAVWTPIQFDKKIPAMKVYRFPDKIAIRPNWEEIKEIEIK